MGRELTRQWLQEMYDHKVKGHGQKPTLEEWANEEFKHTIPGFQYTSATNYYPSIFHQRYKSNPSVGLEFLERTLENASPSFGYKILAQIMASTTHKVAVTTNYDDLIASAITLYTDKVPFVSGYELLADYVIRTLRRPLVAKIHRPFLLSPLNNPDEITQLSDDWKGPLTEIFNDYTPILIGFGDVGGSGGTLMRFLQNLPPIKGGFFWCYREKQHGSLPAKEIQSVVQHHNGQVVPILGFDELMFQLWDVLKLTTAQNQLHEQFSKLVREYNEGFLQLAKQIIALEGQPMSETVAAVVTSAKAALARLEQDSF